MKICKKEGCYRPVFSKGLCQSHRKNLKNDEQKEYEKESRSYRAKNPLCKINSPICTGKTQGVQHTRGRGKYLLDKRTWMPSCNPCNSYVEKHDEWARKKGFKKSRLNKT